ncbi:hypothetical protein T439DRAFT_350299 [Meredithblackwellia eburnea MCA 4105]
MSGASQPIVIGLRENARGGGRASLAARQGGKTGSGESSASPTVVRGSSDSTESDNSSSDTHPTSQNRDQPTTRHPPDPSSTLQIRATSFSSRVPAPTTALTQPRGTGNRSRSSWHFTVDGRSHEAGWDERSPGHLSLNYYLNAPETLPLLQFFRRGSADILLDQVRELVDGLCECGVAMYSLDEGCMAREMRFALEIRADGLWDAESDRDGVCARLVVHDFGFMMRMKMRGMH